MRIVHLPTVSRFKHSPSAGMKVLSIVLAAVIFVNGIWAREVPSNVRSFIGRIKDGKCTGGKILKDGFYSRSDGSK